MTIKTIIPAVTKSLKGKSSVLIDLTGQIIYILTLVQNLKIFYMIKFFNIQNKKSSYSGNLWDSTNNWLIFGDFLLNLNMWKNFIVISQLYMPDIIKKNSHRHIKHH